MAEGVSMRPLLNHIRQHPQLTTKSATYSIPFADHIR
jgi:hypothetical protein